MKRIVFISSLLAGGGVEVILQSLVAELASSGWDVTIWTPTPDPEALRRHYPPGVHYRPYAFWRQPFRRFSLRHVFFKLCKLLMEGLVLRLRRWDTVVAMQEGEAMLLASRLRARRKLAWVHTDYATLHWSGYCFGSDEAERACMAGFDKVVCVSETVRRGICGTIGDPGNLCLRYNPINAERIRARAREPIPESAPKDEPLLVAVGRLVPGKRFDLLLDVCRELRQERRFTLWIVGGGAEEEALRAQIAWAGLSNCVLLGQRDNPYPYIARADWLLSASESESYGLTVQEALILGVPVLACACGGIAECLDPRFGILTGLERDALRDALRRVLDDPSLREGYARRIAKEFQCDELWQPRLNKITTLL